MKLNKKYQEKLLKDIQKDINFIEMTLIEFGYSMKDNEFKRGQKLLEKLMEKRNGLIYNKEYGIKTVKNKGDYLLINKKNI